MHSGAPIKSPEWLVSLNFVLLLAVQATIVAYGRTFGFSRLRQLVAGTLPVVPGALYAWDGGIQDLRRDTQLVLMSLAILFMSLVYVTSPGWQRGLTLGLLVALAQWSRDNAASIIVIVSVPLFDALSVAVTVRAPGAEAPLDQVLSAPVVDQPATPERSGYATEATAVWVSDDVELRRKLPLPVLRKNSVFEPES